MEQQQVLFGLFKTQVLENLKKCRNLIIQDSTVLWLQEAVPFAVVGANQVIEVRGRKVRGRMYPWGVVEVENPEHCDFIKLRTMLM